MRIPLNDDMLADIAVFPLADMVLFPGAVVPLHIFEPRYRAMTQDVLHTGGYLALANLCPESPAMSAAPNGAFASDAPRIHPIAGVGSIMASDLLEDGRYNLLVRGVARVELVAELPERRGYRRAQAKALCDLSTERPKELLAGHRQLVGLCDRLSEAMQQGCRLRELVRACSEPATCVDLVLSAVVTDPKERQQLLETLDPADRIERAVEQVGRLLCEHGAHSQVPN